MAMLNNQMVNCLFDLIRPKNIPTASDFYPFISHILSLLFPPKHSFFGHHPENAKGTTPPPTAPVRSPHCKGREGLKPRSLGLIEIMTEKSWENDRKSQRMMGFHDAFLG